MNIYRTISIYVLTGLLATSIFVSRVNAKQGEGIPDQVREFMTTMERTEQNLNSLDVKFKALTDTDRAEKIMNEERNRQNIGRWNAVSGTPKAFGTRRPTVPKVKPTGIWPVPTGLWVMPTGMLRQFMNIQSLRGTGYVHKSSTAKIQTTVNKLNSFMSKYDEFFSKLDARVGKMADNGADVTALRNKLAQARQLMPAVIDQAKTAMAKIETLHPEDEQTVRLTLETEMAAVMEKITPVEEIVKTLVTDMKALDASLTPPANPSRRLIHQPTGVKQNRTNRDFRTGTN